MKNVINTQKDLILIQNIIGNRKALIKIFYQMNT